MGDAPKFGTIFSTFIIDEMSFFVDMLSRLEVTSFQLMTVNKI